MKRCEDSGGTGVGDGTLDTVGVDRNRCEAIGRGFRPALRWIACQSDWNSGSFPCSQSSGGGWVRYREALVDWLLISLVGGLQQNRRFLYSQGERTDQALTKAAVCPKRPNG